MEQMVENGIEKEEWGTKKLEKWEKSNSCL